MVKRATYTTGLVPDFPVGFLVGTGRPTVFQTKSKKEAKEEKKGDRLDRDALSMRPPDPASHRHSTCLKAKKSILLPHTNSSFP